MVGQGPKRLTESKFSELLDSEWPESMKSEIIVYGFKSTGTFPVDSSIFPEALFNLIDLKEYKNKKTQEIFAKYLTTSDTQDNFQHQ